MTGFYECLRCHEEFSSEVTAEEVDDSVSCPYCGYSGELEYIETH